MILTMSEFGRAVAENGNRGTDHGHGNAMMIIGGRVRGGKVYGTLAGPRARAALRRPRPGGHHRFPQRLRGSRHAAISASPTRGTCSRGSRRQTLRLIAGHSDQAANRRLKLAPTRSTDAHPDSALPRPDPRTPSRAFRPPHALRARRLARSVERNIDPHAGGGQRRAASGCGRTPRRTSRRTSRALQIERGAVGICCAKLGEAEVFADAGITDIRLPYPLNPVNADRVLALARSGALSFIVDHLDVARGGPALAAARGRDAGRAREGRRRAFIAAASIPQRRMRPARAAIAAHARAPFSRAAQPCGPRRTARRPRTSCEAIARDEAQTLRELRGGSPACECEEISVGATPTARFRVSAGRHHRAAARQLRLLRSHAGGARRRGVGRLRADRPGAGRQPPGARPHHSRQRQQDADERPGARARNTPGYGAVLRDVATSRSPTPGCVIERLSEEHATVRVPADGTL